VACRSLLVLLAAAVLAPRSTDAYPIPPVALWELVERSQLIVLAEVEKVSPMERAGDDWNSAVARLRVIETWKGQRLETVEVPYPANMICPAPPVFDPGHRVIAFLVKGKDGYSTVGLSYGTRYPETPEDEDAYRNAVRTAQEIVTAHRGGLVELAERQAWNLKLLSHEATRWDGLYSLEPRSDERHARYDRREPPPELSAEDREALAKAFLSAPPVDSALPIMLRALQEVRDARVTAAAVDAFQAVLDARHFPWWGKEALGLIAARLGEPADGGTLSPLAQTFEDTATASWPLRAGDTEAEVQRAWIELKTRHRLTPRPLPHARGDNWQRPVGGNTTL
jgi:hypothetical protein